MEILVVGGYNIFLIGSLGFGKFMFVKRMIGIFLEMIESEIIESIKIYSVVGELFEKNLIILKRFVRILYYSIIFVVMVGGGKKVLLGEISLVSNGILIFDEMSEFKYFVLEVLR